MTKFETISAEKDPWKDLFSGQRWMLLFLNPNLSVIGLTWLVEHSIKEDWSKMSLQPVQWTLVGGLLLLHPKSQSRSGWSGHAHHHLSLPPRSHLSFFNPYHSWNLCAAALPIRLRYPLATPMPLSRIVEHKVDLAPKIHIRIRYCIFQSSPGVKCSFLHQRSGEKKAFLAGVWDNSKVQLTVLLSYRCSLLDV